MRKFKYIPLAVLVAALVITAVSCNNHKDDTTAPSYTLDQLISQDSTLTIFAEVLKKTHLNTFTTGVGPFTVFAPNNNAYKKMGINSVADVALLDSNNLVLRTTLLIAPGMKSSDVLVGLNVPISTQVGSSIFSSALPDATYFNGYKANKRDIFASNGVLFIMDDYITPNVGTTTATLSQLPDTYKLLSQIITRAGSATSTAVNRNTTTLFAPTNAAFIAAGYDSATISKTSTTVLANLVKYHLLGTQYYVFALRSEPYKTDLGLNITLNMSGTVPTVKGNGNATPANFQNLIFVHSTLGIFRGVNFTTTNGVIHTIDKVLLP